MGGLLMDDLVKNSDSERLDFVFRLDFVDPLEGHKTENSGHKSGRSFLIDRSLNGVQFDQ